jgi:hypothetical protein
LLNDWRRLTFLRSLPKDMALMSVAMRQPFRPSKTSDSRLAPIGGETRLQQPDLHECQNDENPQTRRARIIDEIEEVLDDRSKQGSHTGS